MEWTVVTVVAALIALVGGVLTPVLRLNTSITRLSACVERLQDSVGDITRRNRETHHQLFCRQQEQEAALGDHETRLKLLERKEVQNHALS